MAKVTRKIKIFYALGQLGWSMLAAIISAWMLYFYFPPEDAGIINLIPQNVVFLGITVLGIIMALGSAVDLISNPIIANLSDKSTNKRGRRIPFMRKSAIPFAIVTVGIFLVPNQQGISWINVLWLGVAVIAYYILFAFYCVPYTALMNDLGETPEERIDISTYISVTWFLGFIIVNFAPNMWEAVMKFFNVNKVNAMQIVFIVLAIMAIIFMLIPTFTIDESKYSRTEPSNSDMKDVFKTILKNRDFKYFLLSEVSSWTSNYFFSATLIYYITVLARQSEGQVGLIVTVVGVLSFVLYPLVNILSKKFGKKPLMIFSFICLILSFTYIVFLGKLPLEGMFQLVPIIVIYSIPAAITGILPNAITSDCATYEIKTTGEDNTALYFAFRSFLSKAGNTIAILILPSILALGKSTTNDIGIRLSAAIAAILGIIGLACILKYNEKKILMGDKKGDEVEVKI